VTDAVPTTVLDRGAVAAGQPVAGVRTWGDPPVVLRCGLDPLGPTSLPCLAVDGVDWVVDDGGDPLVFTTYGRDPAVEVAVPLSYGRENATGALVDLGPAVATIARSARCVGAEDA
jgi:hypothetical protein